MSDPVDTTQVSDLPLEDLVACHECDLLMRKPVLALGEKAQCPRCGYELYAHRHNVVERSLALVLAALLLYIPANFLPIMQLNLLGQTSQDTVWSGVVGLYESGMQGIYPSTEKLSNVLGAKGMFIDGKTLLDAYPQLDGVWSLINLMANTSFVFLPALVGWSAAKRFGGSEILGIVLGLMLVAKMSLSQAFAVTLAFVPGDFIKCILCAIIVHTVARGMPDWRFGGRQ